MLHRHRSAFHTSLAASALVWLFASAPASATPVFDEFGPLPEADFGGTGIPNDEVAAGRQFIFGTEDAEITVALSATQRFFNPPLTNDGAGTYFAGPGSNTGGPGSTSTLVGALWNFNYYINVESVSGSSSPKLTDYQIDLYYDFDTALDNPLIDLGRIDVTAGLLGSDPNATNVQGSENLDFGFLATPFPGLVFPPAGSFDPNALGEYNFAITVSQAGFPVESVAIDVQVVPEPGTALLLVTGLAGLAARRARLD